MAMAKKNNILSGVFVDSAVVSCNNTCDMSEIRKAILKQMQKSNLTIYQVAKLVEGEIPQRTVYAFLRDEQDTVTKTASIIMNALGITMTATKMKKKGR